MTIWPVRALIVLLLFNNADAGKLLRLFYPVGVFLFVFFAIAACVKFEFEDKEGAEPP